MGKTLFRSEKPDFERKASKITLQTYFCISSLLSDFFTTCSNGKTLVRANQPQFDSKNNFSIGNSPFRTESQNIDYTETSLYRFTVFVLVILVSMEKTLVRTEKPQFDEENPDTIITNGKPQN